MVILSKRQKFIISSLILTLGLYLLQTVSFEFKYQTIIALSVLAGVLTFWSLKEAAFGLARWMTPILPIFFTAGVSLFYFLLPRTILTAIPILTFYFLGTYAFFLILNIFSVAAIRTISLFRSASAVGFLLTLLTSFFLYNTTISLKLLFFSNFVAFFLFSFPLILVSLWSVNLEEKLTFKLTLTTFAISLFLAEFELALSFWPVTVTIGSLFLTSLLYVILGLAQADFQGRLFKRTIIEYLTVGIAVFLIMVAYTNWG